MRKTILILSALFLFFLTLTSQAHSGRTDKNGGHKCSVKSQNKGLCSSYHKHR